MSEVSVVTPRGVCLSGTLIDPENKNGSILIFVHDFLSERSGGHRYDVMASMFRHANYSTLQFDFSGVGESEDDIITLASEIEDLRAISAWVHQKGYENQFFIATSFGGLVTLSSELDRATSFIVIDPMFSSINYEWEKIFPAEQLEQLSQKGTTKIYDDSHTSRKYFMISKQTLVDLSMTDVDSIFEGLTCPILIMLTDYDCENASEVFNDFNEKYFSKLPDGSKLDVIRVQNENPKAMSEALAENAISWCDLRLKLI